MPIIQAVERALKILDLFDEQVTELKITEISERMQLHKSTVHSLLKTLQVHGYIDQNPENGKYRLGMKLFERGHYVIHGLDIRKIAKRYLVDLSMKTGQTTHLVILDDKEGVYIDKVEGPMATILYSRIGRRIPVHSSAVGKVLVAFLPEEELRYILDGYQYVPQTPNTITNEQAFRQELEKVRQAGYAVDNQENEPGVRCIAVPIRNHKGQVVAAVSISTLVSRVDDHMLMEFLGMLKPAAEEMSQQMGYGIASQHS
ncbi:MULTISPECIES: IclR family transcriptional regulator [Bacillales]|jgi:DNA-binding IclR family transcriptional regulator|uniref:Glycerol operon regulatory protein n=1 Tax=Brevibacillus aydinogluensis TaxID=927786 RepID=A0AA48RHA7_9BACL|nr:MULTISPECIES: IclR family transcriptional regulator [Bacillales]REK64235.1 MAG: IclR family transcriptional regulator [Brevibacillus sp.]MBR8659519.1 IclR family transcriptional regulator [Brevibacillus sp. NL20B1]MDT3415061.1 DNA-binding IclR family transcriptional regulator [Brevibacillus aydinogluensis]NNV01778.1 IclR family transcriptional regulator [Brevibacillus sp. MCWH]UFJ60856.1 IclR family transcriptional regulator [Anoxybacillus sediminis]